MPFSSSLVYLLQIEKEKVSILLVVSWTYCTFAIATEQNKYFIPIYQNSFTYIAQ